MFRAGGCRYSEKQTTRGPLFLINITPKSMLNRGAKRWVRSKVIIFSKLETEYSAELQSGFIPFGLL